MAAQFEWISPCTHVWVCGCMFQCDWCFRARREGGTEGGKGRGEREGRGILRAFDGMGEESDGTRAWHLGGDALDVSDEYLPKLP